MYMLALVSSGSSVRILYPRESFGSWADPLGLSEYNVVASLGFYILGNLSIPGKILWICQSTTKCCCTCLIMLHMMLFQPRANDFHPRADVDDVPALC
jgi:hypothetical protein